MTTLARRHLGITAVTAFYCLSPHPTPDAAGFSRWSARAHRLLASGQIGLTA